MPANRTLLERVARELQPDADELSHLGTGGFASTFRVRRGSDVFALTVIDPTRAATDRVQRELAALQRVSHPNVVAYREIGSVHVDGDTYRWVTMEFIEGKSVAEAIGDGRSFSLSEALRLLTDAAHGDWRSDQFVLGLVGHLLLTGVAPFPARSPAEAWAAPAVQTLRQGPRPQRAALRARASAADAPYRSSITSLDQPARRPPGSACGPRQRRGPRPAPSCSATTCRGASSRRLP
jgi:hypothetical protein